MNKEKSRWEKDTTENIEFSKLNFMKRFMIYQTTRFPLKSYGLLIFIVVFSGLSYTSAIYNEKISILNFIYTAIIVFLLFLQIRICDEFKDYEEDKLYRPYRPVIKGVVTLKELKRVGLYALVIQFALSLLISKSTVIILVITLFYLLLMRYEFFIGEKLSKRPIMYMLSHIVVMSLIALLISSAVKNIEIIKNFKLDILYFMLIAYLNGVVLEIGRKIRNNKEEEEGVLTYSKLFGKKKSISLLITPIIIQILLSFYYINTLTVILLITYIYITYEIIRFLKNNLSGKIIEKCSSLWMVVLYLTISIIYFIN